MATKKKNKKTTLIRIQKKLTGMGSRPGLFMFVGAFVVFGVVVVLVSHAAGVTAGTTGLLASGLKNSAGSVMCLDDYRNASTNGNPVNIYPCNKADGGQQFTPYSDSTIRIHGKCVAISGSNNINGSKLLLATCSTSNYQKWRRHTDPRNSLNNLVGIGNGKCMDVFGSSTVSSATVNQWDCDNTDAQVWGWVIGTAPIVTGGASHNANCDYIGAKQYGDGGCYSHAGGAQKGPFASTGVQADFMQGNPVCTNGCGHSIVEFYAGDATGKNSIEYGWGVQAGATKPTIGIGLWANGQPLDANANFVSMNAALKPGSTVTPGATATYKINYNPATGRWNLYYNSTWLGYFPQSVWTSRKVTFTSLGFLQLFGEIVQPTLNVAHMQMGTGVLGGQTGAATVSNYQLIGSSTPSELTGFSAEAKPQFYNVTNTSSTGFSYGGPGIF